MLPNEVDPARHRMTMVHEYDTGAEEWLCDICGRRFIMMWPPNYKKIFLEYGDETAVHFGEKGGVTMGPMNVEPRNPVEDKDWLEPWRGLIEDLDDSGL